jgi:hypothetical protein
LEKVVRNVTDTNEMDTIRPGSRDRWYMFFQNLINLYTLTK